LRRRINAAAATLHEVATLVVGQLAVACNPPFGDVSINSGTSINISRGHPSTTPTTTNLSMTINRQLLLVAVRDGGETDD
jgi:hypothetical protein